ncbi:MAG: hypothetical protein K2H01_08085 [Ruminococcus sp.]|nr:hypothetical protein [Ruminococcus sp.]
MMYVFQVRPGTDLYVAENLRKRGYFVRCPQRIMFIRKNGEWTEKTEPVFPGYLFLEHPYSKPLTDEKYYDICSAEGVVGFLKNGKNPIPIAQHEEQYIYWLWNHGKPIAASRVYKTANDDCMILSGILREYSKSIVSIDLRQRRAKIRVPICGREYKIALPVISI